ncbi:alpha/beta hydrolase [Desulfobacula phenolica]|uniref:Alpha/beta hydrolase family protein n=1 Tax=Desulfobacula phenolica TaxID=90732 RepID=A0A1H2EGS3_9BACT|nr:acetylxylan esterase [Desulfobacula phenolica]SDT94345.1 Alpha/beta hydrolase family protein [Desulfobacula phenolica]
MKLVICFFALFFFALSCAHYPMDKNYNGPLILPEAIKEKYQYTSHSKNPVINIKKNKKGFFVQEIKLFSSLNSVKGAGEIKIEYYGIPGNIKRPVIMVLPILGGPNTIVKSFARFFVKNGYAAVIVHRNNSYKKLKVLNKIDPVLRQIIIDHMQVLDWIKTRNDLDENNTGVFGISMGGIKAALVTAIDQRIKASVFALAGGDLPYILSYSKEKGIRKKRTRYMDENHVTLDELHNELKQTITCDPLNYARYIDAKKSLMILAVFDTAVPYKKGKELRKKIGNPESIYLLAGHYSAILYIDYVKHKSLDFFRKKLNLPYEAMIHHR